MIETRYGINIFINFVAVYTSWNSGCSLVQLLVLPRNTTRLIKRVPGYVYPLTIINTASYAHYMILYTIDIEKQQTLMFNLISGTRSASLRHLSSFLLVRTVFIRLTHWMM